MSKTKIRIVIICMSMALAGLIGLQTYWIKHDIDIKENQFDMMVSQAMNDAVSKVEMSENMKIMSSSGLIPNMNVKVQTHGSGLVFSIDDSLIPMPPDVLADFKDSIESGLTSHVIIDNIDGEHRRRQIIQQYDSTFSSADKQIKINDKRIQSIEETMMPSVDSIVTGDVEKRMKSKLDKFSQAFITYTKEFDLCCNKLTDRINPKQLDDILCEELGCRGIDIRYNFGLINGNNDSLIYIKQKSDSKDLLASKYKTLLFPNDVVYKPDLLMISFPNKLNFVLESILPVLLSSIIFTIIILAGFAYTTYVIFTQKKLADIKNDFINNMTHEFKTPIATIAIAADTLKNEKVQSNKEMLDYYAGIIKQENTRMNKQVNHVLQMAQIDKGELKLNIQQADVHSLIQDVVNAVHLQIDNKNGKIDLELNATQHFAKVDVNHFTNAINNLVDNAIKYSLENIEIKIKTWNSDGGIFISVSDKGIGMNTETQKKIFEKFYRSQTGNIHDVKGFGLGLSYAKVIIDALNGNINVKSDTGKGSTFTVFIPVEVSESEGESECENAIGSNSGSVVALS